MVNYTQKIDILILVYAKTRVYGKFIEVKI